MAITNGYATLAEIKAMLDITDTVDDTALENAITAASRWIEKHTARRFYPLTETRYYTADNHHVLVVDDIVSESGGSGISSVKLDDSADGTHSVTLATTDYLEWPFNRETIGGDEIEPTTQLHINLNTGDYYWPVNIQRGVQVVADFGYSLTTPADINQACLLVAARLWRRKDALFGVSGTGALGTQVVSQVVGKDGQIQSLLAGFKRFTYG